VDAVSCSTSRGPLSPPTLEDVFVRSERMVGRRIAQEYVLVPILGRGVDADGIFNLNRLGAFVWEQMDGRCDGRAIVGRITETFEVDAARASRDYLGFVAQLLSIDALAPAGGRRET
jgi:coenzyme PQQ synthesis protein D (PqqD)